MKLDDETKRLLRAFAGAANRAVEQNPDAQCALDALRDAGFDAVLRARLVKAADARQSDDVTGEDASFTDSDLKELGRMSIRVK